jgi:negative regulator of flagellin synthesis FlgM
MFIMKINNINSISYVNKVYKKNSSQSEKRITRTGDGPFKDRIELSDLSKEIQNHIRDIENTNVDQGRLDRIKRAIENGSYQVSVEQLADRILERINEQNGGK